MYHNYVLKIIINKCSIVCIAQGRVLCDTVVHTTLVYNVSYEWLAPSYHSCTDAIETNFKQRCQITHLIFNCCFYIDLHSLSNPTVTTPKIYYMDGILRF